MSERFRLQEWTQVVKARQIDEDQGVLHDLVALGPVSANGRDYPESTMRAALPVLEGRQSFANHVKKHGDEPSVYDVLGVWREMRIEDGKVRGNFHYFKTHPLAPRLVEAARRPELSETLGFSINAHGQSRRQGGRIVIESIDDVTSIDCVGRPATVKGLYESLGGHPVKRPLADIIESLAATRPGYARGLQEQADAGVLDAGAPYEEPAAPAAAVPEEEPDHETALKTGFRAAVMACMDDDTLDLAGKIKRIKDILRSEEKLLGGADNPGDNPEEKAAEGGPEMAEESKKLKLENAGLRLLLEAGLVKPGKVLTKALAGCADEAEMKALIQEARAAVPAPAAGKPGARSAPAVAAVQEARVPEDAAKLKSWLRE